ncbi:MAG: hydrogenase, partial [Bacteroidetes bacterium HGW-Bacteroidetes-23]
MKKLIILALIIMLFLAVNYKSGIDFATSIIPGWHTTIYPLWMIVFFIVLLFLIIFG